MQAEPLITWSEPAREFVGFVAQFLAVGAVGFRVAALGRRLGVPASAPASDMAFTEGDVYRHAARRAATLGLFGAVVQAVMLWESLPAAASRAHLTVGEALTSSFQIGAPVWLLAIAIIGFALASGGKLAGWWLAILGVVVGPLVPLFAGKWLSLVNPLHRLMAGFWIGTLFVLVLIGLGTVLRDERSKERRGQMAADMVNGFSPLALVCASVLVLSGLVTAWRHLTPLSSLWTTPYGWTLIVKLCLVAAVFALGAWNWKRQRPQLGSEGAAVGIRRSARAELVAATCVLAATAILLSLPSPRSMQARARAAGAGAAGGSVEGAPPRSAPAGVLTPPAAPAP
jgi:putative copper export protein